METKIIEAISTQGNWGKFLIGLMDTEWSYHSQVDDLPLLAARGWGLKHIWVMDLQTGEGAIFRSEGLARADLNKHRIWVCPLFEPFLTWFYRQEWIALEDLPATVNLGDVPLEMSGYRRPGYDAMAQFLKPGTSIELANGDIVHSITEVGR